MDLYFENSNGIARKIATCKTESDVMPEIHKFIDKCNEKRSKKNYFKVYYIRTWEEDGKKWYDVGSHTEFFYTTK